MASKFQPDESPLKQSEGTENLQAQNEDMEVSVERMKNVRKLTGRNVVKSQNRQLVTNNGDMVGALNGNAIFINNNKIQSKITSEPEIQGIEPVDNIKPLIVPSRLKQFDYQPKYINRSKVLQRKNKFYQVQPHTTKQSRGKAKPRHAELLINKQKIQPLCKEMDSLHLNEKTLKANSTLEKSLLVDYYKTKNTDLVTNDNAADEAAHASNMGYTAITIGKDEVNSASINMHSLSDINVNCTWDSQFIDLPQFTRDKDGGKDSYNVMDSGALLVSHKPANVEKTLLTSAFSSESQENWPTNEYAIINEARPCGFEWSQNNIVTDECKSSVDVAITKNENVHRPICDSPHTDNNSLPADNEMETAMTQNGSKYSTASKLGDIVKPSDDHEREKEQIEDWSTCTNVSTNVYVHGICEETSNKSSNRKQLGKPFTCETCEKSFSCLGTLTKHERIHTGGKAYTCDTCGKCFTRGNDFKKHKRMHTGEKPYKCDTCGKCFSQKCHLSTHIRIHTGEKPYACEICGSCFAQTNNLKNHAKIHTGEKTYTCDTCGKCFSRRENLHNHKSIHTGYKPFACDACGKCFTRASDLKKHNRIHTGEKLYACETCGRCFAVKYRLHRHASTHTGEKPYKCDMCGKSFSQKCHLISHIRIHTGEKPYECDTCGKWFTQASVLERHKRMHTAEKQYKCDMCGKCFSERCYLSTHIRIHTGEKPYICKTCGKGFTRKSTLNNHARTHNGEKT